MVQLALYIRTVSKLDASLRIVLFALLTAAAAAAFPQERALSRSEAVRALASADAATRAEAVVWIANRGGMDDAGLLHERLRDESGLVRSYAEQGLWLLWTRSGDSGVDRQMALAGEQMQAGQFDQAVSVLTEIIQRKPGFAEAWNRRATVYYLAGQYGKSIADCDEVLKRNPKHFGALSGLGQVHVKLEQYEQALKWFRRALEVNPNMTGVEVNIHQVEELLKKKRIAT
jgi:tetratricopeptide (TPR) repeat protein